jgi:hypothetical protein
MSNNETIATLRAWAPKGTRVFTVIRSVNRTNTSREIGLVLYDTERGEFRHIDHMTAAVLGKRIGKRDGVVVPGGGMDMGFSLVCDLAQAIHGDETALTQSWL